MRSSRKNADSVIRDGFLMSSFLDVDLRGTRGEILKKNETRRSRPRETLPDSVFHADPENHVHVT